jgi:hypothetical protein
MAIAAFFLVFTLFAAGKEIEWFRLDYERVHGLPDAAHETGENP